MSVDPETLDTATLAFLAGSAANELILERIRAAGHPHLRQAHGFVFQRLLDGTTTVGELASALGVTQQAVSKSTKELEALGYVQRRGGVTDRRATLIELTQRGRDAIEVSRRVRRELDAQLRKRVGATASEQTKIVLTALLHIAGGEARVRTRTVRPGEP